MIHTLYIKYSQSVLIFFCNLSFNLLILFFVQVLQFFFSFAKYFQILFTFFLFFPYLCFRALSCTFSSNLPFAIIFLIPYFFCIELSFYIYCSLSFAEMIRILLKLALCNALITSSAVSFSCLSFGISV